MKTFLLILAMLAADGPGQDAPSTPIDLDDLRWLEGCWQGTGFGKRVSECWMRAPDGRLTGVFQLIGENGRQEMSEIFVLDEFEQGPALRLKHFDPDLVGWETQDGFVDFELLETGRDFARFDGLNYRLDGQDRLIVELLVSRGGEQSIERLEFERLPLPRP